MIEYAVKTPTIPIPFHKLLKVVALVDGNDREVRALLDRLTAERFEVEISDRYEIRRFGFHGLAHSYMARRYSALRPEIQRPRLVTLQLGGGCSVTASFDCQPRAENCFVLNASKKGIFGGKFRIGGAGCPARVGFTRLDK